MRVLVCGGRDWKYGPNLIAEQLEIVGATVVIHGAARGADLAGKTAGKRLGLKVISFPADWDRYGLAAGPIRNQKMLDEGKPDMVLAFHDDIEKSTGTKDMVRRAKKAGVSCVIFKGSGECEFA